MWIHAETTTTFLLHSDIRSFFNNVSFPEEIDEISLQNLGVYPIIQTQPPSYNAFTEKISTDVPVLQDGQWKQSWRVDPLDGVAASVAKADAITTLVKKIDADADAIYAAALGNRATEYTQAEEQAIVYRSAGYSGDVPDYVQVWADAKGESAQWAADNIIATADAWRAAQTAIRAQRLLRKEQAKAATTQAELDAVATAWGGFVSLIKTQLGIA